MERATGERFDRLMERLVLTPLGIEGCFNWDTCNEATAARAVVLYDGDGKPAKDDHHGRKPDCPVIPAPGRQLQPRAMARRRKRRTVLTAGRLRISANGLARIGRMLLDKGELDGVRVLTPASVQSSHSALAIPHGNGLTFEEDTDDLGDGFFCRYGLAMQTLATPVKAATTIRSATASHASDIRAQPMACSPDCGWIATTALAWCGSPPGCRTNAWAGAPRSARSKRSWHEVSSREIQAPFIADSASFKSKTPP